MSEKNTVSTVAVWSRWPLYADDEIGAARDVLVSGKVNYWTGGQGRKFEREICRYIGTEHSVAVSNGSVALGISLRALGLKPDAEVIVTPRTFIASVSEIVVSGAVPVFADVDPESQNISAKSVKAVISDRTEAIMAVHLAGWPCDMPAIKALADEHGLAIIEDCAQSHGASIDGKKVGAWGDIAAFSFCQDKIMSTGGEGGMIVTDSDEYWQKSWSFKDHGKSIEAIERPSNGTVFQWLHESIGTNARLTEIQAAIGRCQLRKLDGWVERRNQNARILIDRFQAINGLRVPVPPGNVQHAYYKFYVFIRPAALKKAWSRDRIVDEVVSQGVPCGSGICPEVYLEKAFSGLSILPQKRLPVARKLGETSLMFPVHPTLDESHMNRIADSLIAVMARAIR